MSNKKKNVTATGMAKYLKSLLRETTVGISQKVENGEFNFYLPGGKIFCITVTEVQK